MQAVSNSFHKKSQAGVRKHRWGLLMSFNKGFDDERTFFILDSSDVSGPDLLAPVGDSPIQFWDFYDYSAYTNRAISLQWEREIDFPFSVQASVATVVLNNFDNYFSSRTNSPISQYLIPGRPTKLLSGYENEPLLQQFVGLTQDKPEIDQEARTAKFQSIDYLSEIFKINLSESVAMSNVRTDQAIAALFQQFGIESYQYSLSIGRNKIPFLFLEEGSNAADAFRSIMQAEGGQLWIDEQGLIRFDQRLVNPSLPVMTFNESNISKISSTEDTEIINRVIITSNIREVQILQPVHAGSGELSSPTLSEPVIIPAGGESTYNIKIDQPLASYNDPTIGKITGDSWFTASTKSGSNVSTGVVVVDSTLSVNELSLTFQNTNGEDVELNAIEVYGEPAKIVDTLYYEASDEDSIKEYGEHPLKIENDLFGSESNCESFAYTVIDAYSQFDSIIEAEVKGYPSLQLGDIIEVDTKKVSGQFQVIKISNSISPDGVSQVIKAKRYNPKYWFILNTSDLNEEDRVAP